MPGLDRVSVHFDDQGVLKRLLSLTPVLPPYNIFNNINFITRVGHNAVSFYNMSKTVKHLRGCTSGLHGQDIFLPDRLPVLGFLASSLECC